MSEITVSPIPQQLIGRVEGEEIFTLCSYIQSIGKHVEHVLSTGLKTLRGSCFHAQLFVS